jgi:hypothetical protein
MLREKQTLEEIDHPFIISLCAPARALLPRTQHSHSRSDAAEPNASDCSVGGAEPEAARAR